MDTLLNKSGASKVESVFLLRPDVVAVCSLQRIALFRSPLLQYHIITPRFPTSIPSVSSLSQLCPPSLFPRRIAMKTVGSVRSLQAPNNLWPRGQRRHCFSMLVTSGCR